MPNQWTKITAFLLLLLFAQEAAAQQLQLAKHQHYGVEEGLPQSFISGITQDKHGFIWLSTLDGLSRYDGRGFKNLRYQVKEAGGLSANAIHYLLPQANNTMTLIYDGFVVDEFDMHTSRTHKNKVLDKMRTIPGAIWKLHNLNNLYNGRDWVFLKEGYKGIGWLNNSTGTVYEASKSNGLLQQDTLSAFLQTTEGKLFLVSENGVQVSDATKSKFTFLSFQTGLQKITFQPNASGFTATKPIEFLPGNKLFVLDVDRMVILDLSRKTSKSYPIPTSAKTLLMADPGAKVDKKGLVYFKHSGRVYRVSEDGEMKLLWENTIAPHLNITAFYIDRSDVLWVSVNAQGLIKVDLRALPFQSYTYKTSFISDILQQAGVPASNIPSTWSDPYCTYYLRQAYDAKGNLYFSCNYYNNNKIYRFNGKSVESYSLPESTTTYSALTVGDEKVQVFDEKASCWYVWEPNAQKVSALPVDKFAFRDIVLADARVIGGDTWLSTYSNGLLQLRNNKLIAKFDGKQPAGNLPKELTEICPDPADKSRFWVGSRGGGLVHWDVSKGLVRIYTTEDGLPNNTIYCILPDKAGNIWCSTNKGIFRLNPVTHKVSSFEKADGLTGNEFNRAHKFLFSDGRIAFGGLEGFTVFNPADFETATKKTDVPIQLTALQINNQPQQFGIKGGSLQAALADLQDLELPYDQNYLRFEFAAMLFNQPQKISYRYRLIGTDKNWIENGTNNIAAYAGLPPGNYRLQINASDQNGQWSDNIREVSILIKPPFWASWWAYGLYLLIFLSLLRMYFYFREKRIHTEQSLAFEKKEALRLRELEEVKERFFSNITHEFRTPLTLIMTPLEKLGADPLLSTEGNRQVQTAKKNANQLLRLINEFLDFSKLKDGHMHVKLSTGDLAVFIDNIVQSFESAITAKNILFSISIQGINGFYQFDEDKWEKILTNLLSNALKFTPQSGRIAVSVETDEQSSVHLKVSNTGPGIPADQTERIFERFYQVDDSAIRNVGGTGIGLSLVKELAELMGGTISVVSDPGTLTTFTLSIPVVKLAANAVVTTIDTQLAFKATGEQVADKAHLILVVEDNEELRHFLVESLESRYRVIQAADGLIAWEMVIHNLPDLIISDVMMPGQDGFDLCLQVKNDVRTSHICLILLTSKAAHEARMKGLETGADDYITKPFHLSELALRTGNLLQLQQNTRVHLQNQLLTKQPLEKLPEVHDEFVKRLYQEMDNKLDDPELGVDYLASAMAMSRSTLNRKLRSILDISTNELIKQYRLQKAVVFLSSGLDIATVAYKVGFSSPSYFTQNFREKFGITPSDYLSNQMEARNF